MTIRLVAVKPRRAAMADGQTIVREIDRLLQLTGFAGGMIRQMANYPPQQPPSGAGQSLGRQTGARLRKRAPVGPKGYRRTGRLGRNWRMSTRSARGAVASGPSGDRAVEVTNVTDYAVHVEGPRRGAMGARQTREMHRRNWPAIDIEARKEWKKHRPGIVRILVGTNARTKQSRRRRF